MVRSFVFALGFGAAAIAQPVTAADTPPLRGETEDGRRFREEHRHRQDDAARRHEGAAVGQIIMNPLADHTPLIVEAAKVDPMMAMRLHTFWTEQRAALERRMEAKRQEEADRETANAMVAELLADPLDGIAELHQVRDRMADVVRLAGREALPEGAQWEADFLEAFNRAAMLWRWANPDASPQAFVRAMKSGAWTLAEMHTQGRVGSLPLYRAAGQR